jgi:hypothetical protein
LCGVLGVLLVMVAVAQGFGATGSRSVSLALVVFVVLVIKDRAMCGSRRLFCAILALKWTILACCRMSVTL